MHPPVRPEVGCSQRHHDLWRERAGRSSIPVLIQFSVGMVTF